MWNISNCASEDARGCLLKYKATQVLSRMNPILFCDNTLLLILLYCFAYLKKLVFACLKEVLQIVLILK